MESDACYPLFVPSHFSTFSNQSYSDRILEEEPISDLELHFNTLFMLEAEKGKPLSQKSSYNIPTFDKSYTLLDELQINDYKSASNACSWYDSKDDHGEVSLRNQGKISNLSSRTDSFSSEISTCSNLTNDYQWTVSDYGSFKNCSADAPDWKIPDSSYNQNVQSYNGVGDTWLNEKNAKEDDLFFDRNFSGRLTPDSLPDEVLAPAVEKCPLPPLEAAFSKQFGRIQERNASIPLNGATCNNLDLYFTPDETKALSIDNLDSYYNTVNMSNFSPNKTNAKKTEYSKLFENIGFEEKLDDFNPSASKQQLDSQNETDSLIEDLDSLGYYQDDDDDMVGFEEYYSPNENANEFYEDGNNCGDRIKTDVASNKQADDRICFWLNCDKNFSNQTTLVEHIEKVHVNTYKGDEFICLWSCCARAARPFNARYKLLIHMRVHSGHKPNKCMHPGCGKAFSRLENLKIHRRSHTGERPYRCQAPRCHKAFSNSSDRAKHQRTHFNARPYACQMEGCVKRYTDPSSLRKHVKNHSTISAKTVTKSTDVETQPYKKISRTHQNNERSSTAQNTCIVQPHRNSKAVAMAVQEKIIRTSTLKQENLLNKRLNTIPEELEATTNKKRRKDGQSKPSTVAQNHQKTDPKDEESSRIVLHNSNSEFFDSNTDESKFVSEMANKKGNEVFEIVETDPCAQFYLEKEFNICYYEYDYDNI